MRRDLTRREFLNTAAGATVGSAIIGHTPFLNAADPNPRLAMLASRDSHCAAACAPLDSVIFPKPQEIHSSGSDFLIDNDVRIIVPSNPSQHDVFLARSLSHEIGDRFDLHPKIEQATRLTPGARSILMGSIKNPLIRQYCARIGLDGNQQIPGAEGYVLRSDKDVVLVAGGDDRGAFYGMQSLRQLAFKEGQPGPLSGCADP